jgi:BIM1-like copper acquisition factor
MTRSLSLVLSAAALLAVAPAVASAHIQLVRPPQRVEAQKAGPCGAAGSTRGDTVTAYEPGSTIVVQWEETINHPGHFRISFDDDGEDGFVVPAGFDDFDSADTVLLDDIADGPAGLYSAEITLPTTPCERCTLQVIQVMYDKPPYGDGNDIYYQCADIEIRAGAGNPDAPDGSDPDPTDPTDPDPTDPTDPSGPDGDATSSGCSASDGAVTYAAFALVNLALAGLLAARRRRSPQPVR